MDNANKEYIIIRNKKGKFQKVQKNKFEDGEIVSTSSKHYSYHSLSILAQPNYAENRGWVYVENYIDIQGNGGGSGCWHEEKLYKKIDNPILKLYAKRIQLKKDIQELKLKIKEKEDSLKMIEHSLNVSSPNWDKYKKMCNRCRCLFTKNDYNVNSDICDNCYKELENEQR
jgi:hypothetical protein